jgi:V-type H+-transporting ATPase subunit C
MSSSSERETNLSTFKQRLIRITVREFEYKVNESRDREKQRHELKSKSDNLNVMLSI